MISIRGVNSDLFILLVAKTGMRFSEVLALAPRDFDFLHKMLSISKTWDYKATENFCLQRTISLTEKSRQIGKR